MMLFSRLRGRIEFRRASQSAKKSGRLRRAIAPVIEAIEDRTFLSTTYFGSIRVDNASDSSAIGYIAKTTISGYYFHSDSDIANALTVHFTLPTGATTGAG